MDIGKIAGRRRVALAAGDRLEGCQQFGRRGDDAGVAVPLWSVHVGHEDEEAGEGAVQHRAAFQCLPEGRGGRCPVETHAWLAYVDTRSIFLVGILGATVDALRPAIELHQLGPDVRPVGWCLAPSDAVQEQPKLVDLEQPRGMLLQGG